MGITIHFLSNQFIVGLLDKLLTDYITLSILDVHQSLFQNIVVLKDHSFQRGSFGTVKILTVTDPYFSSNETGNIATAIGIFGDISLISKNIRCF